MLLAVSFAGRLILLHLFISPHLDDIALSCGGYVRRLSQSGEDVVMATVCTADAPDDMPLSPSAQHEHWQWQMGEQPYAQRCMEDDRVAGLLGAAYVHMGLLDAIYRRDEKGEALYSGKAFMGGVVHPSDWQNQLPALASQVQDVLDTLSPARVYCPLAAGGHVDHVITRRAAEQQCAPHTITYYEDYPYAQKDPAAIAAALGETDKWRSSLIVLTADEVAARIDAIGAYTSQLFAVFGSAEAMPGLVREYIASTGGERYWERV